MATPLTLFLGITHGVFTMINAGQLSNPVLDCSKNTDNRMSSSWRAMPIAATCGRCRLSRPKVKNT